MNFSIIDFLVNTPEWFIAMWIALISGSLYLLWEAMNEWSDDEQDS